jgi:putative phosphoesterase
VVSDSHGNKWDLFEAIEKEPTAEVVYFLGDGYRDLEDAEFAFGHEKAFISVCGNCDFACNAPVRDIRTICDTKIYATHGFAEKVKFGLYELEAEARRENCQIVLYGHTHQNFSSYKDGLYIFNPGSIKEGFYGVIDITEKGIICFNKNLFLG